MSDYQNNCDLCLTNVLEHWLIRSPPPTMNDLIKALKSPSIRREDIANNIEAMYTESRL